MNGDTISRAIRLAGGPSHLAKLRGITPWAVSKWAREGVPAEKVIWLAEQTAWRVTPHQISPDVYPHPDDGLPDFYRGRVPEAP